MQSECIAQLCLSKYTLVPSIKRWLEKSQQVQGNNMMQFFENFKITSSSLFLLLKLTIHVLESYTKRFFVPGQETLTKQEYVLKMANQSE